MGMPIDTPIVLPDTDMNIKPLAIEEAPDVTNRAEYQLLQKQKQLYYYNKKAQRGSLLPQPFGYCRVQLHRPGSGNALV
jgi:hypothetical protein